MASPIQIILNQESFEQAREGGGGGPGKDFFADRDDAFKRHKRAIIEQLNGLANALEGQSQGSIGFAKVILRRSAWAKSHRPLRSLFKPKLLPLVGGGDLGEMYFEVRPQALREVAAKAQEAEEYTQYKQKPGSDKTVPNPSGVRSELGAIERVELYGPSDRRRFSVDEALEWLVNPMTGSGYHVELFDVPPPRGQWDAKGEELQRLYTTFIQGLQSLGQGLSVNRTSVEDGGQAQLSIRLGKSTEQPLVLLHETPLDRRRARTLAPLDTSISRHKQLLTFLDHHPLVRRIQLPPVLTRTILDNRISAKSSANIGRTAPTIFDLPERQSGRTYPMVGIIDGGVSSQFADWIIEKWDPLAPEHVNEDHGTFISGLAVAGNALNGGDVCPEPDGTHIVDIAVFPDDNQANIFETYYPGGVEDFFDEISNAVAQCKAKLNTRIFNLSLNIQDQATPDHYGRYAARLDAIAEQNDAVIFISAGNTEPQDMRAEWSDDATQSLVALAGARNDGLLMPAESIRNVSVAALNPPGCGNVIAHAPARYSRRGPGVRAGVKPDLSHYGGSGSSMVPHGHGLYSLLPNGTVQDGCGTSYASPLVAKTAAVLDHSIEGDVSRETLIGLLIHHAQMPKPLNSRAMAGVARDLAGFGMPQPAQQILEGDDHAITLVFASRLRPDQQVSFPFAWPPSLITPEGKCRGTARLTLISSPPLDARFGSEFVRMNIDAALQQEHFDKVGKQGWKGRLDAIYLPGSADGRAIEAERIEHGLKWSPVKVCAKTMRGVGNSTNWRMFLSYLTRAGEQMPDEGVPFTALLTIADTKGDAPVFNDMRALLTRTGVRVEDIRTAARVTTRV